MLSIITVKKQLENLRKNLRNRRLEIGYTQRTLAEKSGVSLGSIKRFENSGEIALKSLLKLSLVLECLEDFTTVATQNKKETPITIKALQTAAAKRKRGHK